MTDTTCKFLFCQSPATLLVVKPNHPAIALPQSYMMPNVYQAFQLPTALTNSFLWVVHIPSALPAVMQAYESSSASQRMLEKKYFCLLDL